MIVPMSRYQEEQAAYIAGVYAAESALKAYEHAGAETATPCINELRYAAKHVADALLAEREGKSPELVRELWNRAIRHTHRAKYDVMEFQVELVKLKVAEAIESYAGYAHIASRVIPHYFEHKKALYAMANSIPEVADMDKDSAEYVQACRMHIEVADAFMKDFLLAEEELMAAIEQEKMRMEERADDKRISWLQCLVSCLLGGIVAYIVHLFTA